MTDSVQHWVTCRPRLCAGPPAALVGSWWKNVLPPIMKQRAMMMPSQAPNSKPTRFLHEVGFRLHVAGDEPVDVLDAADVLDAIEVDAGVVDEAGDVAEEGLSDIGALRRGRDSDPGAVEVQLLSRGIDADE